MTERKVKLDRANKSILLRALGDVYYGQRPEQNAFVGAVKFNFTFCHCFCTSYRQHTINAGK